MDINNTLTSAGPIWVREGLRAATADVRELSRSLWVRVFLLTAAWHLATLAWDQLVYPDQAPLTAVIPPALGYAFLVGYAAWQGGKWVYLRLRSTYSQAN